VCAAIVATAQTPILQVRPTHTVWTREQSSNTRTMGVQEHVIEHILNQPPAINVSIMRMSRRWLQHLPNTGTTFNVLIG
jgi:hypothetical protein